MGCNAWNHGPDCDCGWGGDTGGGTGSSSFENIFRELGIAIKGAALPHHANSVAPQAPPANGTIWATSWECKPNAKCPVCGEPVYFVQTENGGRVFFDELGPPWPKHPCTVNVFTTIFAPDYPDSRSMEKVSNDWYPLRGPKITREGAHWNIDGYCAGLGIYVTLQSVEACISTPAAPIFVRRIGESDTYQCSFLSKEAIHLPIPNLTMLFILRSPAVNGDTWRAALNGDPDAANDIGWHYSYFWDDVTDGEKYKNPAIAKYWFSKAASGGNGSGENNYGVSILNSQGVENDLSDAWKYLLRSAFRMVPQSYGHLGAMLMSSFKEFDPQALGLLLTAVGRQLSFQELSMQELDDDTDEQIGTIPSPIQALTDASFRYSPLPIETYFQLETAQNIAKLEDFLPAWNLAWLSIQGIDSPVVDGDIVSWHRGIAVPSGLIDTLLFNLDDELSEQMTLREALKLHPRRFLHFFEAADTHSLSVEKQNIPWKGRVIEKAREAAERITEEGGAKSSAEIVLITSRGQKR